MKITPISIHTVKSTPAKTQGFNGLFGTPSFVTDIEPALQIPMVKHFFYYYPFADESEKQIQDVLKANSDAKIVSDKNGDKYVVKECKRSISSSYTTEDYNKYSKLPANTKATGIMAKIHNDVKLKFIDSGITGSQTSAVNENVTVESQPCKPKYMMSKYHQ